MERELIKLFTVHMPPPEDLMPALQEVLYSGYIGQGPKVEEFERKFGEWIGNKNVVSVNSGTSALHLALRLAGVEGKEVITTPMTCTATNMPILANGGKIVWADVEPETGMLDPVDVERKVTKDTRAIVVVHWGGTPAKMSHLRAICDRYKLILIEDAAHALGAEQYGVKIGNGTADYTIFSLQAIKHITSVDGGVLMVRDTEQYRRAKLLRWYGIDRDGERKDFRCEEDIAEWGYKFHMNDVTATIAIEQLNHIDRILKAHRDNAASYNMKLSRKHVKPVELKGSAVWLYTLLLGSAAERLDFMQYMTKWGVQVSQVHAPNHTHSALKEFNKSPLPGVESFSSRMVCIPVHWGVTPEQIETIIVAINSYPALYFN